MPSRAKHWFPADETDEFKTFRFEDEESGVWVEIFYDKRSGHYIRTRNNFNTPGKWSRLPEPIRNYQIVKRVALEILMKKVLRSQRVT